MSTRTRKRLALPLLAVIASSALLAACTPGSTPEPSSPGAKPSAASSPCVDNSVDNGSTDPSGVLTIGREGNTSFTRNFNPFSPNALYPAAYAMYEPMFILNRGSGAIDPRLATEWSVSADGLSITFDLRENVKWSDGEAFTADDVAFSIELAKENLGQFGYVTDIETPDDHTVTVTLEDPNAPALYLLGGQLIVPEHIWAEVENPIEFTNEDPVATGPFTEVSDFQTQVYQVDRNPDYWDAGKPYIQGVRVPAFPSNDSVQLALASGEIDWADIFVPDVADTFVSKSPETNCFWFPAIWGTAQLYTNTTKAPFDDPNVRKAISMAINREQVVEVAMNGYATPANSTGIGPRYADWVGDGATDQDWTTQNVTEAEKLLDEAGLEKGPDGMRTLPDGTAFSPSIIVGSASTDWVSSSQVIVENLKAIGINASVRAQDWGAVIDQASRGEFDMAHMWSSEGATPYNFYRGAMSTETVVPVGEPANENYQRYGSAQADTLLEQFAESTDENEQKQIVGQLQKLYADDAPAIPLFFGPEFGEFNTSRFVGFPDANGTYADPNTRSQTAAIVLTTIRPRK
jgi:peptide/nickel transport system substrate-binding protein